MSFAAELGSIELRTEVEEIPGRLEVAIARRSWSSTSR